MTVPPTLMVTGAGGRIGRRLRARLDSAGIRASYIVSPRSAPSRTDPLVDVADITDVVALRDVVTRRRPTAIIHLASVSGAACEADPERAVSVNVHSVRSLTEIARSHGVGRIVMASSSAVYGDQYQTPVAETAPLAIASRYADTKLSAELILANATEESSEFSAVALRVFNVYGPGMVESLVNRLVDSSENSSVALAGLDS